MVNGGGADLDTAARVLAGRRIAVLTGAGISTDSGIPDYRGPNSVPRTPMTFQAFLADTDARKRYWAGSHLGWQRFARAAPNAGHFALAQLESAGILAGILTQNVDALHERAGSARVVDLHGRLDRVRCLACGQVYARDAISRQISELNPWLSETDSAVLRPDGDADVTGVRDFVVPACELCGGMLKPDIVFFGEFIPTTKFFAASALVRNADALLVAGSSLVVNSGIRFLDQAAKRQLPVVIVNRGKTRGDSRAAVKIDAGTSETLTALADRLGGGYRKKTL
ncbi:NAD-dependent protein deacetylase [Parafrigoribacterium mesophilum]|uniref:NAD-dependent protein deacetylase n=1 Tax=Parafrigoribacterium mesophilum TaxID=433646 RepID=UPI0031FC7D8D